MILPTLVRAPWVHRGLIPPEMQGWVVYEIHYGDGRPMGRIWLPPLAPASSLEGFLQSFAESDAMLKGEGRPTNLLPVLCGPCLRRKRPGPHACSGDACGCRGQHYMVRIR